MSKMGLTGTSSGNKQSSGKIIALSLFVILLIFIGYSANNKPAESVLIGKSVVYSGSSEKCENYTQTKYVCQNGAVVDKVENCLSATTTIETRVETSQSDNTFSVRRCMSGKCVEAKISRNFDFLYSECTVDEDCYDFICYRKTTTTTGTTTTRTTTTSTTTTTIWDDCTILDCPAGTKYVGSKKTGKYYRCSSECGARILDKYRVCLMTDAEAATYGFERCNVYF